jgi:hypothetical protein
MIMRALFYSLLVALLFTIPEVHAEEIVPLSEKEGKWTFSMSEPGIDLKNLNKEKLRKLKSSLQEISRIITSTPAMKPPKGFEARFWGSLSARDRYDSCKGKNCPPSRPTAVLAMMMGRYEEKNGKIRAAFNDPSTMDISINYLGQVFANLPVLYRDSEGYLLPEPKQGEGRAGMTTFLNNGRTVAVIASKNKPLWLPVSRERYLKAAIETAGKQIGITSEPEKKVKKKKIDRKAGKKAEEKTAESEALVERHVFVEQGRTWIDPADEREWIETSRSAIPGVKEEPEIVQERIRVLQKILDELTPEERNMQARVDVSSADSQQPPLLPVGSKDGVGVVTPNLAYFNNKLPVETPQLITVQWKFSGNQVYDPEQSGISENLNNQKLLEIYRDADWGNLIKRINQTAP